MISARCSICVISMSTCAGIFSQDMNLRVLLSPSALAMPGIGSTRNEVGSFGFVRARPFLTCDSSAYGNARRCCKVSILQFPSFGMYWLKRVMSLVHLLNLPNSRLASITRLFALFVRKTRLRDTTPPVSWCARGTMHTQLS